MTSATLEAWYDASDSSTITEAAGLVSLWNDKSTKGRNLIQGTGSLQPSTGTRTIGGVNALDFQADVISASSTFNLVGDFSIVLVLEIDAHGNSQNPFGSDNGNEVRFATTTSAIMRIAGANQTGTLSTYATVTPFIFTVRRSGTSMEFGIGGSGNTATITASTGNIVLQSLGNSAVGVRGLGNAISEASFYTGEITDVEFNQLGIAYSCKYGVSWADF